MNRSERRRYDKEFSKILKNDGDNCGVCRKPLQHNSRTFGGVLPGGQVVLTSECCYRQLEVVMGSGVFISQNADAVRDVLNQAKGIAGGQPASDPFEASKRLQSGIENLDKLVGQAKERAGISGPIQNVSLVATPWKTDDAQWFESHPGRSHRMRVAYPGELQKLSADLKSTVIPGGHQWEILVRQIEQGRRVRTIFCRNIGIEIPDVEEIIHALFDHVSNPKAAGIVTVEEIAALAQRYYISKDSTPN
ncbi:hypothetical protein ACX1FK_28105 [Pseudomonas aeruginosa]|uniref:hypothetical protein n=1 Tax=Pseudomonas aeruginosa TaxID=287 RepID=UPI000FC3F84E|nr:hypothetical protein [Pseudomonas aeruginosa]ELG7848178.1 hypothetical protein [Pseudomonas aeruginosa]KAA5667221.1 hypothetical protein F3G62_26690 [Pseudomonas aeruginosa]MBG4923977.1 hypothetical protein [Pseudomonas aeruginosa]MBH3852865.1 hypothetical protein [Pseudomonas aeruginosa]MBH4080215.1 hypothetical protein [Pseudomonas aeruginosa]